MQGRSEYVWRRSGCVCEARVSVSGGAEVECSYILHRKDFTPGESIVPGRGPTIDVRQLVRTFIARFRTCDVTW